ncbi:MAG: Asp-tRNA(Asn)/Glu-tRNA(Gln) amidotransferase subunit GatC [Alphaproteobacteria bacterium]|nr:Asp-tRNA(Asn)/Glu-tRNA(Gln) amidotransferase subunit GatC [Alphaproteobacteria bacterium]
MSLDKDTVRKVATLARIKVPDSDLDHMAKELSGVLGWIEQLNEVDISGVQPMTSVAQMKLKMRADEVADGGNAEKVTQNAPEGAHGFFVVPKVVE